MFRLRCAFPVLLAALIFVSSANAQEKVNVEKVDVEKVELRLRLEKGQTFDQVIAMEQKQMFGEITSPRKDDATFAICHYGLHNEVMDSDSNGVIKIKTTYSYVTVEITMNGEKFLSYDSRKPPKVLPESAVEVAALVGQSLTQTVSAKGEILKIEGGEAIVARIIKAMKIPAAQSATLSGLMNKVFKEQTSQRSGFVNFPENPLAIGDAWKVTSTQSAVLPLTIATRYKMLSRKSGFATLGVNSRITANHDKALLLLGNIIAISMSGTQTGVFSIDETNGLVREAELHQEVKGTITAPSRRSIISKKKDQINSMPVEMKATIRMWTIAPPRATAP